MSLVPWVLANALLLGLAFLAVLVVERWVTPIPHDEAGSGVPLIPPLLVTPDPLPVQPPPVPVTPLGPDQPPAPEAQGHLFAWTFVPRGPGPARPERHFSLMLPISEERYQRYRAEPRERDPRRWAEKYAAEPMPELDRLAWEIGRLHLEIGLSPFDQASNVLCFAQSCVRYEHDWITHPGHRDWPNYPIESLYERLGDCEDFAILTAAVLKRLGFDVALLMMPGHMAVGLATAPGAAGYAVELRGVRYLFGETTSSGWTFGQLPGDVDPYSVEAYPVIVKVADEGAA